MLIDHPAYTYDRISYGRYPCLCVDTTHVDFLKNITSNDYPVSFVPHGASLAQAPAQIRDIDILFAGSGGSLEEIKQRMLQDFGPNLSPVLVQCSEKLLLNYETPVAKVIADTLISLGLDDDENLHGQTVPACIYVVDIYARTKRRLLWMQELDDLGIAVDVYGNGWEACRFKHHRIHGPVSYHEVLNLMSRAKITLNIGPLFPAGSHERALSGMANGSVVVSDSNEFFQQHFSDAELIMFKSGSITSVMNEIVSLLQDDERRQAMAELGHAKVLAQHLWQHRADAILSALSQARANLDEAVVGEC